jgi:hypothetical protein
MSIVWKIMAAIIVKRKEEDQSRQRKLKDITGAALG